MKILTFLMRYSKGVIAPAILLGMIGGASSAALMVVINSRLSASAEPSGGAIALAFAGLVLAVLASNLVSRLLLVHLSQKAVFDLSMHLCRQVLSTPLRHLETIGSHRILAALTQDIPTITTALIELPFFFVNATILVGCLIYLGWLSWVVLVALVAFMVLGFFSYKIPRKRAKQVLKLAREQSDELYSHYRSLTDGAKELKLHRRRRNAFFNDILQATATTYRRHYMAGRNIYAAVHSWGQVLYFIYIGLLLFALPYIEPIDGRTMTVYIITLLYMRAPISVMTDLMPTFGMANISLQKVKDLGVSLDAFGRKENWGAPIFVKSDWKSLEVSGVTHAYFQEREERNFVLGPIDLTLRPGELVFIMGGNGSGKTTLAKLLTGLYIPEGGEISLDGEVVTDENREAYRQYFSVVFSDYHLFDQLLGLKAKDIDVQAREYIAKFHLDHKVDVQEGKLSTTQLSQGQRKRLALVIACLEDRPIYLFDEWAADQDPTFKEIFYYHILPELKERGKTVIVISHDNHYYHVADRLIKLDYGRIEYDKPTVNLPQTRIELPVSVM